MSPTQPLLTYARSRTQILTPQYSTRSTNSCAHDKRYKHSLTPTVMIIIREMMTLTYTYVMLIAITITNVRNPHCTTWDKLKTSWQTLIHRAQSKDQRLWRVKVPMLTRMVVTLCVLLTLAASAWFMKRRGFSTFSSPVFCLQSPTYSNERDKEWLFS